MLSILLSILFSILYISCVVHLEFCFTRYLIYRSHNPCSELQCINMFYIIGKTNSILMLLDFTFIIFSNLLASIYSKINP
nr:p9 [Strawberry pallidosis-associated virus]